MYDNTLPPVEPSPREMSTLTVLSDTLSLRDVKWTSSVSMYANGAMNRFSSAGGVAGLHGTVGRGAHRPLARRAREERDASIGGRRRGAPIIATPSGADVTDSAWGITIPKK